jgi:hypothetical protein
MKSGGSSPRLALWATDMPPPPGLLMPHSVALIAPLIIENEETLLFLNYQSQKKWLSGNIAPVIAHSSR